MIELTPKQKAQMLFPELRKITTFRLLLKRYLNETFIFWFTDREVKFVRFGRQSIELILKGYIVEIPLRASMEDINEIVIMYLLMYPKYKGLKPEQLYKKEKT